MIAVNDTVMWAQAAASGSWVGYLLFPLAGLLVGATYAAYKARARGWTLLLGLCATVALAWMILFLHQLTHGLR